MRFYRFLCLQILISTTLISCKHDAPDNPCNGKEVSGEGFKVFEVLNLSNLKNVPDLEVETDTVYGPGIVFRAVESYDTYTWIFEKDSTVRYGKEVSVDFGNPKGWGVIKVMMIGKRKPNLLCRPGDDGTDTFVKAIYNVSISQ